MTEREQRLMIRGDHDTVLAVIAVREMGERIGMRKGALSSLATAVSEMTTNIVKYATSGKVTIRVLSRRGQPGLEVLVEDRGPGIEDIKRAMEDHVSTSGTLGLGLPGTRRLVDDFAIESEPGQGTRIRLVKWG